MFSDEAEDFLESLPLNVRGPNSYASVEREEKGKKRKTKKQKLDKKSKR